MFTGFTQCFSKWIFQAAQINQKRGNCRKRFFILQNFKQPSVHKSMLRNLPLIAQGGRGVIPEWIGVEQGTQKRLNKSLSSRLASCGSIITLFIMIYHHCHHHHHHHHHQHLRRQLCNFNSVHSEPYWCCWLKCLRTIITCFQNIYYNLSSLMN